jgi:hypothetical protein
LFITIIVCRDSDCRQRILAQPDSQPDSTHGQGAGDDLPPAFKVQFSAVQLPGEATPHRNQRYYYFARPAFALINPAFVPFNSSTLASCEESCRAAGLFILSQLSVHKTTPNKQISLPPSHYYARETRDRMMLPLPDKTRDPCSHHPSSLYSPER